ncbi:MAG: hypothetical protein ABIA76_00895 [Candidatus Diapherotrites archaeon]
MHKNGFLFGIIFLVLFSLSIFAFNVSGIPSEIEFNEKPEVLSFYVENNSGYENNLSIEIAFPGMITALNAPRKIGSGETEKIVFRLNPSKNLIRSVYLGKIKIKLGDLETERTIKFRFNEFKGKAIKISFEKNEINLNESNELNVILENQYLLDSQEIELVKVENPPFGWKFSFEKTSLDSLEQKTVPLTVNATGAYSGTIILVFESNGIQEKKELNVIYEQKGNNSGIFGLFVLPELGEISMGDLLIDFILILIVAVLLISFISKLTQFLYSRDKKNGVKK